MMRFQITHPQKFKNQLKRPRKRLRKKSLKRRKWWIALLWLHMTNLLECKNGAKTIANLDIVLKLIANANNHFFQK